METTFFSFDTILWWHWCTAGLVLIALEILAPGVFLLWIGLGALATGLVAALSGIGDAQIQCLIFIPLVFASLFLGRRFIRKAASGDDNTLNRRTAACIGRTAEVVEPIAGGRGRIRLGDTVWTARGEDCPRGTAVVVTGGEGTELFVRRADATANTHNPSPESS
ncbi:MAG: NfeD family protein [Deltaproteobacteria bacterium]|jgi:membrane protein implicated in regulation of membrane protease activity|nr:NfeD family protein [Deltaproteobacteria bacterium]